jgi:hypothetical protein
LIAAGRVEIIAVVEFFWEECGLAGFGVEEPLDE